MAAAEIDTMREYDRTGGENGDNADDNDGKDRQFVNALARGLEVLRCFRPGEQFLTNAELAKRCGIPKPTITRLTYTLTKLGYLNYSEHLAKYQLGAGVLALFVRAGLVASNGEARRQIKGGGLRVNDVAVTDEKMMLKASDITPEGVIKLSFGKKRHVLLKPA